MKIHADATGEEVQIQIVPLIDVIFCILTFFILAALQLTRQQAINIDLPKATTGTTQMREMLVVTINQQGQTFVDKQFVDRNQLYQTLQNYRIQNPNGLLVLNASQLAFYNDVVQVLDLMRQVGGDRVALATLPADPSQPPGATPSPTTSPTFNPFDPFGTPNPPPTFNPGQFQFPATPGLPPGTTTPVPAPTGETPQAR
jgi:biopolymer transport protein ExbD